MKATYSMLSQVTFPLAEAGYYVVPVALADETFRQNGLTSAGDVHQVSPAKLREIYGADAALYVTVSDYGTRYMVISSATIVTASAKLVDLRSGTTLWTGSATASSEEGNGGNNGGLVGMLITAAVKQIINSSVEDAGYPIAGMTSARLLGRPAGRTVVRPALAEVRQRLSRAPGLRGRLRGPAQAAGRGLAAALRLAMYWRIRSSSNARMARRSSSRRRPMASNCRRRSSGSACRSLRSQTSQSRGTAKRPAMVCSTTSDGCPPLVSKCRNWLTVTPNRSAICRWVRAFCWRRRRRFCAKLMENSPSQGNPCHRPGDAGDGGCLHHRRSHSSTLPYRSGAGLGKLRVVSPRFPRVPSFSIQ